MTRSLDRLALDVSNVKPGVPVSEIAAATRHEEARAAMAVVAGLREGGVPVRDIVVVARDLDTYEEPLTRAAIRYGVTPVFWTQIRLTQTRPFRLLMAICELFATPEPDRDDLFTPLELGWTPRSPTDEWLIRTPELMETYHEVPSEPLAVETWQSLLSDAEWADTWFTEYIDWVAAQPAPTPDAVTTILGAQVAAYRESVLPDLKETDSPALLETETAARAVVRAETLVEQVESKYAQRLAAGQTDQSWVRIAGICESLARQRPGRREHANAHALDIVEANDIWGRNIPYVIAVGLVDGEWPRQSPSIVPTEVQNEILAGDGPAKHLSPRIAWTDGRDLDQFADTLRAATDGLILTRYTRDLDGIQQYRPPLLDHIDVEPIDQSALQRLLSTDRALPETIRSMLPNQRTPTTAEASHD